MSNTYFKVLNNNTKAQFIDKIISDVQNDLRFSSQDIKSNILDAVLETKRSVSTKEDLDINNLLKYYVLNQIMKDNNTESQKEKFEKSLEQTANPNIKFNVSDKKYYRLKGNEYMLAEEIITVDTDGSYTTIEKRRSSSFNIRKTYSNTDKVLSIQLLDSFNNIIDDKWQVAEILEMKKEFAKKHKYAGYSGNSSDFIAGFLNKISQPIETGCYMDKQCNLYKWSVLKKCFIRSNQIEHKSALLIDYEFTNNIVIRKEYTGV